MSYEMSGADNIFKKTRLVSTGLTTEELEKPLVLILCEQGCENAIEHVKFGVLTGGGSAVVINMPALCDMTADGAGKNNLLYARESVCDLTESLLSIYPVGAVAIIACSESAAAGMIMGALRSNIPLAFMPAFLQGAYYPSKVYRTRAQIGCGKAGISALEELEDKIQSGRSVEMDNLNSLCVFLEASGLAVKDSVGAATSDEKIRAARSLGNIAAARAQGLSYPRMDFDAASVTAGLAAYIAVGGTAAALIHILAIAAENQIEFDLKDVEKLSEKLPQLVSIAPFGESDIRQFVREGGVFAVLKQLLSIPKLLSPTLKIGQKAVAELAAESNSKGSDIIATVGTPRCEGGFLVIRGNLFDYGVCRRAVNEKVFKGVAAVFDSEEQLNAAAAGKTLKEGSVVLLRGQNVKDRGMPLLDAQSHIAAAGLTDVVIITDGRTLETDDITTLSLCTGGAMSVVKTGDPIEIDFKKCKINLNVPGKEINQRLKKLNKEESLSGGLLRYSHLCGEPNNGCILKQKF